MKGGTTRGSVGANFGMANLTSQEACPYHQSTAEDRAGECNTRDEVRQCGLRAMSPEAPERVQAKDAYSHRRHQSRVLMFLDQVLDHAWKILHRLFSGLAGQISRQRNQGRGDEEDKPGAREMVAPAHHADAKESQPQRRDGDGEVIENQVGMYEGEHGRGA